MSIELKVPEVGESVTEVYIGRWYKSEGDSVEQGEQLVELESEKATLDLRAPAAGVLSKILRQTGDTAEVGEVVGQMREHSEEKSGEDTEKPPAEKKKPPPEADEGNKRAAEQQAGTTEQDGEAEAPPAAERQRVDEEKPRDARRERAHPPEPTTGEQRVAMSPVRRRIAKRLVEAQQQAALLTTFNEIDMTAVQQLRQEYREPFEKRHGVRLGLMSFFVKACVEALRELPELNAMIDGEEIVYRHYYDIGVAISTEKGLVVPVLRGADRMSFADIERAIARLASRARDGELKVEELQGGTFTITNGGVFGSLLSTPLVNPPQSGVLGMHAIQERPVAAGGEVVVRPMMYVALTYDHRLVDGREAVTFLRRIKDMLEDPARLLIDV